MKYSGRPLDNQTWQTEWKTVPLTTVQLCEYENQTLEVFGAVSYLCAEFDCPVGHQNISFSPTVHDCEVYLSCYSLNNPVSHYPKVKRVNVLSVLYAQV